MQFQSEVLTHDLHAGELWYSAASDLARIHQVSYIASYVTGLVGGGTCCTEQTAK
jgi:hypothetical protein